MTNLWCFLPLGCCFYLATLGALSDILCFFFDIHWFCSTEWAWFITWFVALRGFSDRSGPRLQVESGTFRG